MMSQRVIAILVIHHLSHTASTTQVCTIQAHAHTPRHTCALPTPTDILQHADTNTHMCNVQTKKHGNKKTYSKTNGGVTAKRN